MDWLKAHEYLAVWLTLPLMVLLAIVQGIRGDGKMVSVPRMTIYFAFMICLAAVFTPTLDDSARIFAGIMSAVLMAIVAHHAYIELMYTYPPRIGQGDSIRPPVNPG
jgi:hypothetical protein